MNFELAILLMYITQLFHSAEELLMGFPNRWYFKKLSYRFFIVFEVVHTVFWSVVLFTPVTPFRIQLLGMFFLLMLANGVQHLVWMLWEKKYVPGIITGTLHILIAIGYTISHVEQWK